MKTLYLAVVMLVVLLAVLGAGTLEAQARRLPVDRGAIDAAGLRGQNSTDIPTAAETPSDSNYVPCGDGEYWDPYMDRCRRYDEETPSAEPTYSDAMATNLADGDPYDNDYEGSEWCWEYVNGGKRIYYFLCPTDTPEP